MEVISNEDRLLRRVQFLDPNFIKDDGRPASSSFSLKSGEDGLSVDLERLTTYAKSIQDRSRFRLYALRAGFTVSLGLIRRLKRIYIKAAHKIIAAKRPFPEGMAATKAPSYGCDPAQDCPAGRNSKFHLLPQVRYVGPNFSSAQYLWPTVGR